MRKIHPNRFFLEDYRKKRHKYSKGGFWASLKQVRTWAPIIHKLLSITGFEERGLENALDLKLNEVTLELKGLGESFNDCRILFISDFHIEALEALPDKIIEMVSGIEYDYCFLGGDYSLYDMFDMDKTKQRMEKILGHIKTDRTFGILGNHDYYETAEFLQSKGVTMLVNEHVAIRRGEDVVYLTGVDDSYIFDCADIGQATAGIPAGAFKILLTHTPQIYKKAHKYGFDLLLAGHTHGGQICLPNSRSLITSSRVPKKLVSGLWEYKSMAGYTTKGAGVSGNIIARFNCPPEIVVFTLKTRSV